MTGPWSTLAHHFSAMAYQNAWANLRLGRACAQLSPEEFRAPRVSFFPSIPATLNHILTVDWFYVDAIERSFRGSGPNPDALRFFEPEEPYDTVAELISAQRAVDRRLVDACSALTTAQLESTILCQRTGRIQKEAAPRLFGHLFQHQIHHRGQVHAMLAGTSVKPPQLDEFFCAEEAHLRAADLAELGYSEAQIWGPGS